MLTAVVVNCGGGGPTDPIQPTPAPPPPPAPPIPPLPPPRSVKTIELSYPSALLARGQALQVNVEVICPTDYMGDILGDLSSRRGKIGGMTQLGEAQVIAASVPLSEMFAALGRNKLTPKHTRARIELLGRLSAESHASAPGDSSSGSASLFSITRLETA